MISCSLMHLQLWDTHVTVQYAGRVRAVRWGSACSARTPQQCSCYFSSARPDGKLLLVCIIAHAIFPGAHIFPPALVFHISTARFACICNCWLYCLIRKKTNNKKRRKEVHCSPLVVQLVEREKNSPRKVYSLSWIQFFCMWDDWKK